VPESLQLTDLSQPGQANLSQRVSRDGLHVESNKKGSPFIFVDDDAGRDRRFSLQRSSLASSPWRCVAWGSAVAGRFVHGVARRR
jgi:hypothetical protein